MTNVDQPDYYAGAAAGGGFIATFSLGLTAGASSQQTGPFPLAAVDSFLLYVDQPAANPVQYEIVYVTDTVIFGQVGPTQLFTKNNVPLTEVIVPVGGAYGNIIVSQTAGPAQSVQLRISGWSGLQPESVVKVNKNYTPILGAGVVLPASGSVTVYPSSAAFGANECFPGRGQLTVESGVAATAALQVWNGTNWFTYWEQIVAALSAQTWDFITPLSDWRLVITNTTAGASTVNYGMCFEE